MSNIDKNSFIIDCNVAIKWYFQNEEDSNHAFSYLIKATSKEIILFAPSIIISEFANVISKYSKLNNKYNLINYFNGFENTIKDKLLNVISLDRERNDVLALAMKTRLSYYDAEYLYLSNQLNCELITFDKQLAKAAANPNT